MARIAFAYLVINKVLGEAFDHELLGFFFLGNLSDWKYPQSSRQNPTMYVVTNDARLSTTFSTRLSRSMPVALT